MAGGAAFRTVVIKPDSLHRAFVGRLAASLAMWRMEGSSARP
jgi:hypothetical protein